MSPLFLPNEILLNIISYCGVEAIPGVALANKQLHALCGTRLAKYKKYRHVILDFRGYPDTLARNVFWHNTLAITFLGEILSDPDSAQFVQSLTVAPLHNWEQTYWLQGDECGNELWLEAHELADNLNWFSDAFQSMKLSFAQDTCHPHLLKPHHFFS